MKQKLILSILFAMISAQIFGQVMGNANYQYQVHLPANVINVPFPNSDEFIFSIKGLSNVKADNHVAIFSLNQAAETAEEVNRLIDNRIRPLQDFCAKNDSFSIYVDMISFMPIYELDLIKKVFNKKTYNEVPKGFEVKKNIHIRYKNPGDLNRIISLCSKNEIYDLVRVDYFADNIAAKKEQLMKEALSMIEKKLQHRAKILGKDPKNFTMQMSDGFTVVYPVEMYTQYKAVSCNKFSVDANSTVNKADKSTTYYYKPYFDKNFDFTVNPTIFEPVIQVVYEIKVKYTPKPIEKPEPKPVPKPEVKIQKEIQIQKEVIIVTPSGEMKTVSLH